HRGPAPGLRRDAVGDLDRGGGAGVRGSRAPGGLAHPRGPRVGWAHPRRRARDACDAPSNRFERFRTPRTPVTLAPSRPASRLSPASWALFALALGGFTIGTTEFATMGMLPQFGADLGVSD